jgi:uncharacterized membrane protein YphA (DoxX/SURF4 family)
MFCLRLALGWQILYEGLAKLLTPAWTSAPYLALSRGIFSGFFHWLASSSVILRTVDLLNIWGLILIGLALFLGFFTRFASAAGMLLLAFYYLAQPPLIQRDPRIPVEGHYLLVDKNVVELLTLVVFFVLPSDTLWGLDRLLRRRTVKIAETEAEFRPGTAQEGPAGVLTRRATLGNLAAVPLLGVVGYGARQKYSWEKVHAITGATIKLPNLSLKDLKGQLPHGTLGKLKVSRLILGGNLMSGGAHSRDLIYVSSLFKAYNTDRKVFETLDLAERAGINTFLLGNGQMPMLKRYRDLTSGKMQTICQVFPNNFWQFLAQPVLTDDTVQGLMTDIDKAIDYGMNAIYVNGSAAERFVKLGRIDLLGKALDRIKGQGFLAGLGGHSIEVPIQCEKAGLNPDFYVKTLHHDNYWSAHPRENRVEFSVESQKLLDHSQFHDNIFDLFPEKTIEFMGTAKKPWIAFKVLAGGSIPPKDGFKFAFENGADFICVGMFDFQIVEDVNIALEVLGNLENRTRPWYA